MSVAATIVARIAGAERALAFARAETLARTLGGSARPWWDDPRACVAMLVRHGDPAIAAVLDDTPAAHWSTAVPDLNGHSEELLRALLHAWWSELQRVAAGEVIAPTEAPPPPDRPPVPAPAPEGAPPPPPSPPATERRLSRDDAAKRLGRLYSRWFDAPAATRADPVDAPDAPERATAWWEVAPDAQGHDALWLVCPPLGAPDTGPRTLRWEGALRPVAIRRENLARLGARIEAAPGRAVLWSSPDAIPDTLRDALTPQPFPVDGPTLFRRDIEGPSQRCAALRVARDARYAVLLPPALAPRVPAARALDGGWALWSLDVPADPGDTLLDALSALGITPGEAITELSFALVPPTRWATRGGGVPYPVFATDPVVRVRAVPARGDLSLFLHGPHGTDHHPLASIASAELVLEGLRDGAHILELTASDPSVAPTRLAFAIARDALGAWPRVTPSASLDGAPIVEPVIADLTELSNRLAITAPPASRVRVRWEGFARWEGSLHADADGHVPTDALDARTAPLRAQGAEGRLTIDFGEDGAVAIHHLRTVDAALAATRDALTALSLDAATLALGDVFLTRAWAERAAAALGFASRGVPAQHADPTIGWVHLRLDDLRWSEARREVVTAWVFAVVPPHLSAGSPDAAPRRAALDALARRLGAQGVILTDGTRWWSVASGKTRLPPADRLDDALRDDEALAPFLSRYSAWR